MKDINSLIMILSINTEKKFIFIFFIIFDDIKMIMIIISMRILINNLLKWYKDIEIDIIIWSNWRNRLNWYIHLIILIFGFMI